MVLFLLRLGFVGQPAEGGGGVQRQEVAVALVEGAEAVAVEGGELRRGGAKQPARRRPFLAPSVDAGRRAPPCGSQGASGLGGRRLRREPFRARVTGEETRSAVHFRRLSSPWLPPPPSLVLLLPLTRRAFRYNSQLSPNIGITASAS